MGVRAWVGSPHGFTELGPRVLWFLRLVPDAGPRHFSGPCARLLLSLGCSPCHGGGTLDVLCPGRRWICGFTLVACPATHAPCGTCCAH